MLFEGNPNLRAAHAHVVEIQNAHQRHVVVFHERAERGNGAGISLGHRHDEIERCPGQRDALAIGRFHDACLLVINPGEYVASTGRNLTASAIPITTASSAVHCSSSRGSAMTAAIRHGMHSSVPSTASLRPHESHIET